MLGFGFTVKANQTPFTSIKNQRNHNFLQKGRKKKMAIASLRWFNMIVAWVLSHSGFETLMVMCQGYSFFVVDY